MGYSGAHQGAVHGCNGPAGDEQEVIFRRKEFKMNSSEIIKKGDFLLPESLKVHYKAYFFPRNELIFAHLNPDSLSRMGAIQSYIWAVLHPDYVEAIMPIGGITAMDPVAKWLFQNMTAAMKSDPAWRNTKGNYYDLPKKDHPNKGMMFGWSVLGQTGLSFDFRNKQSWDVVKKDVFYWESTGDEGAKLLKKAKDYDVNDLIYRNRAGDTYNINGQLHRIKAKTLIIHVENDQWLRYEMAKKAAKKIKGAKLIGFESPLAHYAVFRGPNMVMIDVIDFLK